MSENAERGLKAIADGRAGLISGAEVDRQIKQYMAERGDEVRELRRIAIKASAKVAGLLLMIVLLTLLPLARALGLI